MPSLIESPRQLQAAGAWGYLYSVQEPVKPRHMLVPAAAAKKPAYGLRKKNLETCTEALGCETGAIDAAPAGNGFDGHGGLEDECAERKRRTREEEAVAGRVRRSERRTGPLPPPLTTLARGASRVRMVHERRDGRLEVYAVRTPGVLETERSGGRLRMRFIPLPCGSGNAAAACCRQERQGPEANEEARKAGEEDYSFSMYVRGSRCVEPEDGAAAARRGKLELCQYPYPCIF